MPGALGSPAQDKLGDADFLVFGERFQQSDEFTGSPDILVGEFRIVPAEIAVGEDGSGFERAG